VTDFKPAEVTELDGCAEYLACMRDVREACAQRDLVPLYFFTSRALATVMQRRRNHWRRHRTTPFFICSCLDICILFRNINMYCHLH
jgi:hypothetical protein